MANDDIIPELKKSQPPKVKALINRIVICKQLAGEAGADKQAMQELAAAMRKYKCNDVTADEAKMAALYKSDPAVLAAFRAARAMPLQIDADP
ncbi:hypothetical protein [Massilia sp. TSP1-1-2]|uniref:hypothetical protein n=1 Tax=unclassified Massilia TaxID=2609279 RepID=UPI003CF0B1FD